MTQDIKPAVEHSCSHFTVKTMNKVCAEIAISFFIAQNQTTLYSSSHLVLQMSNVHLINIDDMVNVQMINIDDVFNVHLINTDDVFI